MTKRPLFPMSIVLSVALLSAMSSGSDLLRFQPPPGYSQDFHVEVDGNATARGEQVEFEGELELNQTIVAVPEDEAEPIAVHFTINGGSIRYDDRDKQPRYIGEPLHATRTRLGVIYEVEEPLDDDDDAGIDVSAAVLYAMSLICFPERATRPGKEWDGSHEAHDPYGGFVPVTATNMFADLLELPDGAVLVDVSSEGSFPYRAKIDDRVLHGDLEFKLFQKLELATGALRESDLTLTGGLRTRAGPVTVSITVHKLHVKVTETSHQIVDVTRLRQPVEAGEDDEERGGDEPGGAGASGSAVAVLPAAGRENELVSA